MAQQLANKTYFSMRTKQGVEEFIKNALKTHLEHWLKFVGKDTKLKETERTDCENYFHNRTKNKRIPCL